jgi:hemerythrin superfamily protein
MNASRALVAQHRVIGALFDEVDRGPRRSQRVRALSRLAEELVVHIAAEEGVFYPVARSLARREPGFPPGVARPGKQHVRVRMLLRRVLELRVGDVMFAHALSELRAAFARHVWAQESTLFPLVEGALGEDQRNALDSEVLAARPAVWLVTTEGGAFDSSLEEWGVRNTISLPMPAARG